MLKWIGFSVSSFIFIMAVVFGVVLILKPPPKPVESVKGRKTAVHHKIKKKHSGPLSLKDSLLMVIDDYEQELKAQKHQLDSLTALVQTLRQDTQAKSAEIEKLNIALQGKTERNKKAKEMAKTFASMKVKQISPILNKLDDETIISIYLQTSKPARKNIIAALTDDRAARITKKLIN